MKTFICLISIIAATTCFGSQEDDYRKANPVESTLYHFIPTSIEAEIYHCRYRYTIYQSTIDRCFDAVPSKYREGEISAKHKRMLALEERVFSDEMAMFNEIKEVKSPGDQLCLFKYNGVNVSEEGYLIIRAGKILKKWIMVGSM